MTGLDNDSSPKCSIRASVEVKPGRMVRMRMRRTEFLSNLMLHRDDALSSRRLWSPARIDRNWPL